MYRYYRILSLELEDSFVIIIPSDSSNSSKEVEDFCNYFGFEINRELFSGYESSEDFEFYWSDNIDEYSHYFQTSPTMSFNGKEFRYVLYDYDPDVSQAIIKEFLQQFKILNNPFQPFSI